MRIAQIAPLFEPVPPAGYGGTERVIATLCDELVARGHDVTLFAAEGSETTATLAATGVRPLRTRMRRSEMLDVAPHLHLRYLADVYARAGEFDVIHSHLDLWTLPFTVDCPTPTVLTLHGRLDLDQFVATLPRYPDVPLVSISDAQRGPLEGAGVRWAATVHNGLDLRAYLTASPPRGEHFAFVGRIHPEKGPVTAVEVAARSGRELRVAAKIDPLDLDYHERVVAPAFEAGDVSFVGELDETRKPEFYASAAATVFPSDWPEPFGLVMIESMAAGTPVIALDRGAVPEILVHGETGFVCRDLDEMLDAVGRIGEIDPDQCRRRARDFDGRRMADGYEAVYRQVAAKHSPRRRGLPQALAGNQPPAVDVGGPPIGALAMPSEPRES